MKIEQMISGEGWLAVCGSLRGDAKPTYASREVLFWALYDDGQVRGLVIGDDGKQPVNAEDELLFFLGYAPNETEAHSLYQEHLEKLRGEDDES